MIVTVYYDPHTNSNTALYLLAFLNAQLGQHFFYKLIYKIFLLNLGARGGIKDKNKLEEKLGKFK